MTYTIAGVFRPDLGSSADGLTVQGYAVSSWSGAAPSLGTAPPGSPPVGGTTSTDFGDHGAWELALPTNEDYYVVVEYSSSYYWQRCNVPAWTDGAVSELDVQTTTGSGLLNADNVNIAGTSAFGLSLDTFDDQVQPVRAANSGSVGGGSIAFGAFVDHQHAGLGESLKLPGTASTRYAGATTGGAPTSGTYLPGDFVIDQTGEIWVYNASSEWVPVASGPSAGVTGTITAFAGIVPPSGWLACDGSAVSRTGFAALFGALSLPFTGTTHATTTVSGISTVVTALLQAGWPISGPTIPSGTTIASVSSGTILLSAAATGTGVAESLVASPWGVGDGSTTFNVPDLRGRTIIGSGAGNGESTSGAGLSGFGVPSAGTSLTARILGAWSGQEQHLLTSGESGTTAHLHVDSGHSHTITDPGHGHAGPYGFGIVLNTANPYEGAGFTSSGSVIPNGANTASNTTDISAVTGYAQIQDATAAGAVSPNNNMQPVSVVNYIIKS
jgi:microcystin-dependent protein